MKKFIRKYYAWIPTLSVVLVVIVGFVSNLNEVEDYFLVREDETFGTVDHMATCGGSVYFSTKREFIQDGETKRINDTSRVYVMYPHSQQPEAVFVVKDRITKLECSEDTMLFVLLYTAHGDEVMRYDIATGKLTKELERDTALSQMTSAAGRVYVVYYDDLREYMNKKSTATIDTAHAVYELVSARYAPFVAYTTLGRDGRNHVAVYNVESQETVYVDTESYSPGLSPDGKLLAYVSGGKLYIQPVGERSLPFSLLLPFTDVELPIFSPNGEWIAFLARPDSGMVTDVPVGCSLYKLRLSNGQFEEVATSCPSVFAWTSDSETLVYPTPSTNNGTTVTASIE